MIFNVHKFQYVNVYRPENAMTSNQNQRLFYCPEPENILAFGQKQTPKLSTFIVVYDQWIDHVNRKVIVPALMRRAISIGKQTLKSIFCISEITDEDYYLPYKTSIVNNVHQWVEYSYSVCAGPFVTFNEAFRLGNVLNSHFTTTCQDSSLERTPKVPAAAYRKRKKKKMVKR
jgi:hypothetical protein